ncbi:MULTISPECIES: nucleoside triphosphate pyrophosphohydrolase [Acetobacterium]|uniref:nucleoside triphosphate pyrophosphohydrolase n=1 Tax=Acetobacterium TaxID=33951 RepID=UPI000B9CB5A9|nr:MULTISPECIES: nucleoside triphosphate pyrophosphohydrolase [Acetobacterium]MEA4806092.1 nucleoside triphosphate pyrophosphohydrolase [Acetobacterium wieringae]OXS27145.1 MAG: nucleoside triphosphate pyrophosphohydrolase [Acetobacterium sp. MES1]
MHHIDIVGLGPGSPGQITLETLTLLKDASPNFFRTTIHPVMDFIRQEAITYQSFDCYYEQENSFEAVYDQIVATLIETAKTNEKLVYAVPGNPLFGEKTVEKLIVAAKAAGISYRIYPGVSFVDVTLNSLEADPINGLKIIDAFDLFKNPPDPRIGTLVTQVYDRHMASELKLQLMEIYDPEKRVVLLINSGIPGAEKSMEVYLYELDRIDDINHLTSLFIPAEIDVYQGFQGTVELMKALRAKEGCSWDRSQTHESLRSYLLEESYEVLEAIDNQDWDNLAEELGDVLFQIVFHAEIASEAGRFNINQVISGINEKMIRRHPHVFIDKASFNPDQVETNWDAIKRLEKGESIAAQENPGLASEMKKIPKALPALMEAYKVQKKAAKVGFDWPEPTAALEKIDEETHELRAAMAENDPQKVAEELGDLLFSVVNVSRLLKLQPELVLRKATEKFIARFGKMEEVASQENKSLNDYTFEELDEAWNRSKGL